MELREDGQNGKERSRCMKVLISKCMKIRLESIVRMEKVAIDCFSLLGTGKVKVRKALLRL